MLIELNVDELFRDGMKMNLHDDEDDYVVSKSEARSRVGQKFALGAAFKFAC